MQGYKEPGFQNRAAAAKTAKDKALAQLRANSLPDTNSELGVPPLIARAEGLKDRHAPLRLPADPASFLLDFLPFEMRKIRREGIELFHAFYWHGALASLVANRDHKLPVKYNPLNLSAVYVELPGGGHMTIPTPRPPTSAHHQVRA